MFFLFFVLSHPVLAIKNAKKRFLNFFEFFSLFFRNFHAQVEYELNSGLNIFSLSFSAYLIPFWLKIMSERGFLIFFLIFCYFFRNVVARVEYERNLGLKFFFLFFRPISFLFWLKMMSERGFVIF